MLAVAIVQLPPSSASPAPPCRAERRREYVAAARMVGASRLRLMFRTVLPNCMAPLIVQASLAFSTAILDTAALGFLGLGAQPPTPEWGTMLADALQFVQSAWWVVTFPGLAILLTVLGFNLIGDGLRDALDPRLKRMSLLEVRNLRVTFDTERGPLRAVDGLDLDVDPGDVLGLVGESGSGKSVAMLAVMGLIRRPGRVTADRLAFDGQTSAPLRPRAAAARRRATWR